MAEEGKSIEQIETMQTSFEMPGEIVCDNCGENPCKCCSECGDSPCECDGLPQRKKISLVSKNEESCPSIAVHQSKNNTTPKQTNTEIEDENSEDGPPPLMSGANIIDQLAEGLKSVDFKGDHAGEQLGGLMGKMFGGLFDSSKTAVNNMPPMPNTEGMDIDKKRETEVEYKKKTLSSMSGIFGQDTTAKMLKQLEIQEFFTKCLYEGLTIQQCADKTLEKFQLEENVQLKINLSINLTSKNQASKSQTPENLDQ